MLLKLSRVWLDSFDFCLLFFSQSIKESTRYIATQILKITHKQNSKIGCNSFPVDGSKYFIHMIESRTMKSNEIVLRKRKEDRGAC
jgi:hypothetical protein